MKKSVTRSTSNCNPPDDPLRVLALALAPYLKELAPADSATADDWVDVAEEIPSRKRQLYRACRDGELAGRKVARRWLVRRSDLDRWIESHAPKATPADESTVSSLDAMRSRLGLARRTG